MMADHMPDYVTKVLGKLARSRRRQNPALEELAGPAVGSGSQSVMGPARSHLALDVDTESDADADFGEDPEGDEEEEGEAEEELPRLRERQRPQRSQLRIR